MVFSSLEFLYLFLPISMLLYFSMPTLQSKNVILTIVSLIFYAWGEPVWIVLLVISALVDYINGILINRYRHTWKAKAALISSLVINLGLLIGFKYINFFLASIGFLLNTEMVQSSLVMPIGISFYTFQTLSYALDVYGDKVKVQRSFHNFLLFVSLFPQLIAGPILRYSDLASQLDNRKSTLEGIAGGFIRFMVGLGKKVLIANFVGQAADTILGGDLSTISTLEAWIGILCYTFQIYFDFSGYSDMAIGLGRIFGFHYGENFRYPYISRSVTDFWRRWHISLGSFFRDYVYIPLGGNRRFQVRNILIVWLLTGFWHGASWNFVLWGLYFGILLIIEKFLLQKVLAKIGIFAIPYAFILAVLGWVLFYFTDLQRAFALYAALFGIGHPLYDQRALIYFQNNTPLLILAFVAATPLAAMLGRMFVRLCRVSYAGRVFRTVMTVLFALTMLGLSTIALVGDSYNPFLYFRF